MTEAGTIYDQSQHTAVTAAADEYGGWS